jgi:hypothetical protein
MVVLWSVKGGQGVSVTAACLALSLAESGGTALLVDLCGDAPPILGVADGGGPGLGEWLASPPEVGAESLDHLAREVGSGVRLLPAGAVEVHRGSPRWHDAARHLAGLPLPVVVDAGSLPVPPALLAGHCRSVLVIRPCYLALRRAVRSAQRIDCVILLDEPGRVLRRRDVESCLGVPVAAEVMIHPSVARAVDSGLLASRRHGSVQRFVRAAA